MLIVAHLPAISRLVHYTFANESAIFEPNLCVKLNYVKGDITNMRPMFKLKAQTVISLKHERTTLPISGNEDSLIN